MKNLLAMSAMLFFMSVLFIENAYSQGGIYKDIMSDAKSLTTAVLQGDDILTMKDVLVRFHPVSDGKVVFIQNEQIAIHTGVSGKRFNILFSSRTDDSYKRFCMEDTIRYETVIKSSTVENLKTRAIRNKRGKVKYYETYMGLDTIYVEIDVQRIDRHIYIEKGSVTECDNRDDFIEATIPLSAEKQAAIEDIKNKLLSFYPDQATWDKFKQWRKAQVLADDEGTDYFIEYFNSDMKFAKSTGECTDPTK